MTAQSSKSPDTMKAGQWDPKQQKCVVNEIAIPEPGPGQFLIKIASASLCHSDLLSMIPQELKPASIAAPDERPITVGHEGAGYIHKFGAGSADKGFSIGQKVGFLYFDGCCFECEGCQAHNMHCTGGTPQLHGFVIDGFFQEYATVDWQNCIVLPNNIDIKRASPIFCAGITAFRAVDSCNLKPGQWFGVIGAGGLGQLATQHAKAMGLHVVAIDIKDDTLAICKSQGADHTFNSKTDPEYAEDLKTLTKGGCHAAAVFSDSSAAYASAPSILRVNGIMMVVGVTPEPLQISSFDIALAKYRIMAESTGTPQRMKKAIDFTAKHNIRPEVEFRKLEELDDMRLEMMAGNSQKRKVVLFD